MKRIIALLICLTMMLSSLTVIAAVPFVLDPVTVTYGTNAVESNNIIVTGQYDKPVVLRVFNDSGTLEYIDTTNSVGGVFQFDAFKLKKPATATTVGTNPTTYKFVVSDDIGIKNAGSEDVAFNYVLQNTGGGGGGGGAVASEKTETSTGWDDEQKKDENETTDQPVQPDAPNDTLNKTAIEGAAKQTTASGAAKYVESMTKATSAESLATEATRNTIAVSVETMIANIGSKKINASSSTNTLVMSGNSISDSDIKKYTDTEKTIKNSMSKNNISLNRELSKEYIVSTAFNTSKKATITIDKAFVSKLEKIGIEMLTINDKNFRISYSLAELKEMLGEKGSVSFDIDTSAMVGNTKKLSVSFNNDKTQSVKIAFPGMNGASKYMAIVDENGKPVGGRYNPATGAIEAKISESGVYEIVNNEKDFEDIKNLSEEMQESIKILAAKGIIEGTSAKEFSPEDAISRAEVAALLLRVLSQIDPNEDGGFTDVKKADWFFGTAGSAKKYGLIMGYEDNTFRGNVTIAKDQILAIAARVLRKEMKYINPEKPEEWTAFADSSTIASWAENDIALASMANIITRTSDNTIHATDNINRGDAALIIMRLFYKIW